MAILVNKKTRVLVQGVTGRDGSFHAKKMKAAGTLVVAGVTPGKKGLKVSGIPVFDTVESAVLAHKPDVSVVFVPALFAKDAVWEALSAGIGCIVVITEGVPVGDMAVLAAEAQRVGARIIGPNCPGLIVPGECLLGIIPETICKKGPVGVVSRSGTLTYEIVHGLTSRKIGQSTCIGIGGDPVVGTRFVDVLRLFEEDPKTHAVVMIGEIGGQEEEEAAAYVKKHMTKPVVAFIAGKTAPPGRQMGHAGAIVSGSSGTAEGKVKTLSKAGIAVAETPDEVVDFIAKLLKKEKKTVRRKK